MAEYPEQIVVGSPPYETTYDIQVDQVLLRFDAEIGAEEIDAIVAEFGFTTLPADPLGRPGDPLRETGLRWVTAPPGISVRGLADDLIAGLPDVVRVSPVYLAEGAGPGSAASPLPDTVVARLAPGDEQGAVKTITREFGLFHNETVSALLAPYHVFTLPPERLLTEEEAIDAIDDVARVDGVERVELDWLKLQTWQRAAGDTYRDDQWDMAQIQASAAWDAAADGSGTWIAVIDWGFSLAHPDLAFTPNTGPRFTHFDAEACHNGHPPPYDANRWGDHGMPVAGIAAATAGNELGVAGVAGGCRVMPIHIGGAPPATAIAGGIRWATDAGASVVNMSFTGVGQDAVIDAIARAWAAGLVLCAATGNDAVDGNTRAVGFPAGFVEVIAVGASDREDLRQQPGGTPNSSWGSQYGPEIAVVAPGIECWSTDWLGSRGYNTDGGSITWDVIAYDSAGDPDGDYIALFNGTSAATPHVSGLAAVIWATFPTLTNQQVRDAIERSCDKIRPDRYAYATDPGHPNGPWNDEVGYGRINCDAALAEAARIARRPSGDRAVARRTGPRPRVMPF